MFLENLPHGDHHSAIINTVYLVLGVCGIHIFMYKYVVARLTE